MNEDKRRLNEYLFWEFGHGGEPLAVSDCWPYDLRLIGVIDDEAVYEFQASGDYYAFGSKLNFMPKAGMTFDDLEAQVLGARWIAARQPVSLAESRPSDPRLPTTMARREALQRLALQVTGDDAPVIEGLYLVRENSYLALAQTRQPGLARLAGLTPTIEVPFPGASSWRRLAWGVGMWLRRCAAG